MLRIFNFVTRYILDEHLLVNFLTGTYDCGASSIHLLQKTVLELIVLILLLRLLMLQLVVHESLLCYKVMLHGRRLSNNIRSV
jgi:hypothetical protein